MLSEFIKIPFTDLYSIKLTENSEMFILDIWGYLLDLAHFWHKDTVFEVRWLNLKALLIFYWCLILELKLCYMGNMHGCSSISHGIHFILSSVLFLLKIKEILIFHEGNSPVEHFRILFEIRFKPAPSRFSEFSASA